eukprot:CAMPEP_0174753014 /NCGR_PEP_ID=MMETSP1094-20130205/103258_1 /TAXON_ID=156173 /ORGANISM="Chrysochromulina brevifilum, Strain UTEX LB 985" /LENGTH=47 /DNA_ID= /DNA_START= /DNA_END= /DNA_ORIENTATION=
MLSTMLSVIRQGGKAHIVTFIHAAPGQPQAQPQTPCLAGDDLITGSA